LVRHAVERSCPENREESESEKRHAHPKSGPPHIPPSWLGIVSNRNHDFTR
jgi:hypothetical protein